MNHRQGIVIPILPRRQKRKVIAEEEGFEEIAEVFKAIAVAERQHEKRFLALLIILKKIEYLKKKKW